MNKWQKYTHILLALILLSGLSRWSAAPLRLLTPRLQPLLLHMVAAQPQQRVRVIVQKTGHDHAVENQVASLGGQITTDLHIINAFAAEMTASAAFELAQADGVKWVSLDAPIQQSGGPSKAKFTTWATTIGATVPNGFTNATNMLSSVGINNTYGYGGKAKVALGGFTPEYSPGNMLTKVEVALRLYVSAALGKSETPKITAYVGGVGGSALTIPTSSLNACLATTPCTLYFDLTGTRTWRWSDFVGSKNLELVLDQTALVSPHSMYYDAIGLRVTTIAGTADTSSPLKMTSSSDGGAVDTSVLSNVFNRVVRATDVWNESPNYYKGAGVTIAVVDSGSFKTNAIGSRFIGEVNFNSTAHNANDQYGHGTFVVGVVGDDGSYSGNKYMGIAPMVNILGVRVSDDAGMSTESDVVNALQWINDNKAAYNIRVVNLSLNSSVMQSYNTAPLDAAVEILWFNSLVVAVSAGNNGSASLYPPANDPFVITVGATDDKTTVSLTDDVVASFSAYGTDESGGVKPDLVASGKNIIAYLPDTNQLSISVDHPTNRVDSNYFRMSGTSMAAPIVSGAAAILLETNSSLTPDQVKYRLKATANKNWPGYNATQSGAGYLDIYAAVHSTTTQNANTGIQASQLLWTGSSPITWNSVNWNSVNWNSVNWNSVNWNSVNWNSVNWNSDYWGDGVTSASVVPGVLEVTATPNSPSSTPRDTESATQAVVFLPLVVR
jgi:serine protease AprX